jgi:amicyanin
MRSTTILAALLLWAGCSAGNFARFRAARPVVPPNRQVKEVVIDKFKYQPDKLEIHAGETVQWENVDIVPHTVTAAKHKLFDSGSIPKGASWRFTFTRKGTYDYHCTLHPNMKGKLVVD